MNYFFGGIIGLFNGGMGIALAGLLPYYSLRLLGCYYYGVEATCF